MRYLVKTERFNHLGKKLYPPTDMVGNHKTGYSVGDDGIVSEIIDTEQMKSFAGLSMEDFKDLYEETINKMMAGTSVTVRVVGITSMGDDNVIEDIASQIFTQIDWMDSVETLLSTPDIGANDSTPEELEKAYFNNTLVIGSEWCGCIERKELESKGADFDDTYYFRDRETGSHGWACLWCNKIVQAG